jgi:pSer/pThr/pTyr-binding forkhead associated (FHA) protein/anti-anti-sigma regulatory factor
MLTLERDDSRDDSALLPGMFRLEITAPDGPEPTTQVVNGSFALLGRAEGCTCRFNHPEVARRHAYLQAIYGRLYCIDLGSGGGTFFDDVPRPGGWFDPESKIRIGPYQIRLVDTLGLGSGSDALPGDFNPLERFANERHQLPQVTLHVRGSGRRAHYTISRPITLVGATAPCKLRLGDPSVSSIHCSLLWLPDGLWAVDLAGKGGTSVQGKTVRCAKIAEGERLRVGKFTLRVHYPTAPEAHRRRPKQRSISIATERSGADGAALEGERAALAAERQAFADREQSLGDREGKMAEAQMRLAAEWEQYHAERAALVKYAEDLAVHHEAYATEQRRQVEQAESLERQRNEIASRAEEVAETRKNLKAEWQKLEKAKSKLDEAKQRLSAELSEMAALKDDLERRKFEIMTSEHTPQMEFDTTSPVPGLPAAAYDVLESTRHNKVFSTEPMGDTLVVIPLGDAHDFHYGDVHTESNKIRRLVEGGNFKNLVVDLGSAPIFTAVTIKVVVVLSQIISNRGGRAVLCEASEKTRGVLESMRLLDLWQHFPTRAEALRALEG